MVKKKIEGIKKPQSKTEINVLHNNFIKYYQILCIK